jgi:phage terminase large subunit-like protein
MGLLDKAKEKAGHLAGQAKDKIDDVKEKRKVDDLLDDLGRTLYRQRTERGEPGDEDKIVRLVGELRALESDGAEVVAPVSAPVEDKQPPPPPPPPGSPVTPPE